MLQWEVAARLSAVAGDKHYGQLSVVMQNVCTTKLVVEVPPEAFNPRPKVDSAVIQIVPRDIPLVPDHLYEDFLLTVKSAFSQRRKTLRNNLKGLVSESEIISADVDPGLRAEVLDITDFKNIAACIYDRRS